VCAGSQRKQQEEHPKNFMSALLGPSHEGISRFEDEHRNVCISPLWEMIFAASRAKELIRKGNKRKAVGTSQMNFSNTEREKNNGFYGVFLCFCFFVVEQLEKLHVRDEPKSVSNPAARLCPDSVGVKPLSTVSNISPCSGRLGGCVALRAAVADGCRSPKS